MQIQKIQDPENDEIGKLLKRFHEINSWTQEKHILCAEIFNQAEKENYIKFIADGNTIGLTSIGSNCLFEIPLNQRGSLAIFKGQRIRVICLSQVKYSRYNYLAKCY
jgi:hypothetical protein